MPRMAFYSSPTRNLAALSSLSPFFFFFCRTLTLDRQPWLHRSRSRPKDSDPAPPRRRHHPLQKIHMGSFPERPSGSIISPYSTACLSQNKVFPPSMRSSTSLSRTAVGRHSVHRLSPEYPRLCGSSTPICLSKSAPPSSFEASGSSLVPKPSTRFTAW